MSAPALARYRAIRNGWRPAPFVTSNARVVRAGRAQRIDPTKLGGVRRRYLADINRQFAELWKRIRKEFVDDDIFGLDPARRQTGLGGVHNADGIVRNLYQYLTDKDKVVAFKQWLDQQFQAGVISNPVGATHIESAYRKAVVDAYARKFPEVVAESLPFYRGSREEFLRSAFTGGVARQKIELLATRVFEEMKGLTEQMKTGMNRVLADGMLRGAGPMEIARELKNVMGIGTRRARTIARTELTRAHAEGTLDSYKELGIEDVGVLAEWSTAGDDQVCIECIQMEGKTFTVDEARGMIPVHPNCRCAWIPSEGAPMGMPTPEKKTTLEPMVGLDTSMTLSDVVDAKVDSAVQLGGSTGARLLNVTDSQGATTRWVAKNYSGRVENVLNEFLTNRYYLEFGSGNVVPDTRLAMFEGKATLLTRFNPNLKFLKDMMPAEAKAFKLAARKDFVTDAWLANWDVVGLSQDNIAWDTVAKKVVRIDNGGALRFRAQGTPKANLFGYDVNEIKTLLDPTINPASSDFFGKIAPNTMWSELTDFIKRQQGKTDIWTRVQTIATQATDALAKRGLVTSNTASSLVTEYAKTLTLRFESIKKQRTLLGAANTAAAKAKKFSAAIPATRSVGAGTRPKVTSIAEHQEWENKVGWKLTYDEKQAVREFTGYNYTDINNDLIQAHRAVRAGTYATVDDALQGRAWRKVIHNLDRAFEKSPEYDAPVIRGVYFGGPKGDAMLNQWKTGAWANMDMAGFSSASPLKSFRVNTQLYFPRGHGGMYVDAISENAGEYEVLIPRGTNWRVTHFHVDANGTNHIALEPAQPGALLSQVTPTDPGIAFFKTLQREAKNQALRTHNGNSAMTAYGTIIQI